MNPDSLISAIANRLYRIGMLMFEKPFVPHIQDIRQRALMITETDLAYITTDDVLYLCDACDTLKRWLNEACTQIKEFRSICDPHENQVLVTHIEMIGGGGFG